MVNVTKSNFIEQSNDFLRHLPSSDYVAIDEEMTGISPPGQHGGRPRKEDPPAARYAAAKVAPERYSIVQLGVSLHRGRSVRRYNFYVFPGADGNGNGNSGGPPPKEIVLNPGTVHFLNQHGMSFDVWTRSGIPYCTREQASDATGRYLAAEARERAALEAEEPGSRRQPSVQEALSRRVELRRPEDVEFVARAMAAVREWLDAPAGGAAGGDVSLLLPPCNSFLRRALFENIAAEYPDLTLESVPQDRGSASAGAAADGGAISTPAHYQHVRALRLTPDERRRRRERLRDERWEHYASSKIGMWRVVSALSQACRGLALDFTLPEWAPRASAVDFGAADAPPPRPARRVPLVVHNGWMDLLFLMTHFESPVLPPTLAGCKRLVRSYFPAVYDTKVLSAEYCGYGPMNLSDLYRAAGDKTLLLEAGEPEEKSGGGGDEDGQEGAAAASAAEGEGAAHQADYDAYMTGAVFAGLSRHLRPPEPPEEEEGEEGQVSDDENVPPPRPAPAQWQSSSLGRNRIYNHGLYTLDLESDADPLAVGLSAEASFRVTGFDPSVTTKDVVDPLNELADEDDRPVNFELVWIDDRTFIVSTRYRPSAEATLGSLVSASETSGLGVESEAILEEHGRLVRGCLEARFGAEAVSTLGEYLKRQEEKAGSEPKRGWLARLLELVGLKRKPEDAARQDEARSTKRQRRD